MAPPIWGRLANTGYENARIRTTLFFAGQARDGSEPYGCAPTPNTGLYTVHPVDDRHLKWHDSLDNQLFALSTMIDAGLNVATMSSWGEGFLGCGWAGPAPMQVAPTAQDELFDTAASLGLLIMPLIESRGDWSFRDEFPTFRYPDGRIEVAPGTVSQIIDLIARYVATPSRASRRNRWARVYDRHGEPRHAVVIIQAGSSVLEINEHAAFARGFDQIAELVYSRTCVKVGFLIDALPNEAPNSPPRTKMRPSPEDTARFLRESCSFLGIQCFVPELWLGNPNDREIIDWKDSFSRRWFQTGIPFIMDVSPGYDNHKLAEANPVEWPRLKYGNNLPWRAGLSEMVERYAASGTAVNSWNGYTEGMAAIPTREYGDAFYVWVQAINRREKAMSATYRMVLLGRRGRCVENLRGPAINKHSVVIISASEIAWDGREIFGLTIEDRITSRFVGAADITIKNISPSDGRVDFVVTVDWPEPLNITLDITILDPPVETILGV